MTDSRRDWPALLNAWLDAEGRGDSDRAFDLLVEIVAALPTEWPLIRGRKPGFRHTVLNRMVEVLQERDLHEHALAICTAARQYADQEHDSHGVVHFELLAVHSCVALLDLRSAAVVLARVLAVAPEQIRANETGAVAAAAKVAARGVDPPKLHVLRVAALLALGRYLAASGRLTAADQALTHAIALLEVRESPTVSLPDVRTRLAEVRLDRGDFEAVEHLHAAAQEPEQNGRIGLQWGLIRAQLYHLQARFSHADTILHQIAREPHAASLRSLVVSAAWQRIDVLAALNRLDEAEEILAGIVAEKATADVETMRALLAARREAAPVAFHLPPASRQVLVASESYDPALPPSGSGDLGAALAEVRRSSERVRDDYGRLFNRVLLALHTGDRDSALLVCAELSKWSTDIDSDLVAARQRHLWALVYYYWGDWVAAEHWANEGLDAYERLGMLGDQWTMSTVLGWLLRRRHAEPALLDRNRERRTALLEAVKLTLTPADQSLFSLNKWMDVDEEVATICRELHETIRTAQRTRWPHAIRDWKLRRAATNALRRIRKRRRIEAHSVSQSMPSSPHGAPDAPKDVYRLALEATERRLANPDQPSLARQLVPCWLPVDTAVLQYIVLPDRLELFLMTRAGCGLIPLREATTRPDLWERTRATLIHLQGQPTWRAESRRLSDLAIRLGLADVLDRLPSKVHHLAIVPDDILAQVPFAALPVNGQPLIATHALSVMPTMLWVQTSPGKVDGYRSVLGVAVVNSPLNDRYPALEGAVDELAAIRGEWDGAWHRMVNDAATRSSVASALPGAELAHFACHGEFFPDNPDASGLLLNDGWLTVADIYGLRLDRLSLAVLASCWGGSVTALPGGEHIGLPFALLDQGARAVIASLWKVPDRSNIEFVRSLYGAIERQGPIAGLATTQRESASVAPPQQWAGYLAYAAGIAPRHPLPWLIGVQRAVARWRRNAPPVHSGSQGK